MKQREVVRYLTGHYPVSERRACRVAGCCRSGLTYASRKDPLTALRQRLRELAQTRVRFGYRRLHVLMQRDGWDVGKERFTASTRRKGWPCAGSGRGDMPRRCTASSDDRRPHATTSGAWTSWRTN